MTARRVEGWKPGDPLPPPGTIVGDISLHAPGVKFGVVLAPEPADRVKRITSDDPAIWRPAVTETVEAVWPKSIAEQKAGQTEEHQLKRWGEYLVRGHRELLHPGESSLTLRQVYERQGYIGLAILDIEEDLEDREHRSQYVEADLDDVLDLIDQLEGEADGTEQG